MTTIPVHDRSGKYGLSINGPDGSLLSPHQVELRWIDDVTRKLVTSDPSGDLSALMSPGRPRVEMVIPVGFKTRFMLDSKEYSITVSEVGEFFMTFNGRRIDVIGREPTEFDWAAAGDEHRRMTS